MVLSSGSLQLNDGFSMMGGLVTYEAGPTVTLFEMLQVVYLPDHIKTKLYILPNLSHMGHQI